MESRVEILRHIYSFEQKIQMQSSTFSAKIFQAANGIFGKIGLRGPHYLTLSLIDTFCNPVLMYGLEAMPLSKSEKNTIDFTYSTTFFKIFKVKEKSVLNLCQFYSRCLPPRYNIDIRQLN